MHPRTWCFAAWALTVPFTDLPSAEAAEYTQVNATASQISFTYNQMGSRVYGTFGKFEGSLDFDTRHPEVAHAALTIDVSSIDAGSSDANSELQKPAWFDTATWPVGTFESSRVQALGDNRYLITGQLTLKGLTREVDVQVVLKPQSGVGVFDGQIILKRDDFKIGSGEWADGVVSNEIDIKFRVVAPQR
ncbi:MULTISPECIES: YceI family protein [unclassified Pseudomonas]|uniref:YceI family protein n=1 Tax=unclassified Pseudomonas TaxID=196821 RepID=UPI002AC95809|nr:MULTISPECIES: YceI family protein [unclassified Pseudomonas]MEB0045635.1 YceI family protein [Pseudomonas sp. Dout3]MEB0095518.1 YceI family protein [Pseudomonas sp. DC1.2]WPX61100.1 YceI family protein [Pseudomonas sp. DC1.2]